MSSIQGGLNKDHLGGWGLGSCVYCISPLPEAVAQRITEQISGSVQANVVGQLDVDNDPEPD